MEKSMVLIPLTLTPSGSPRTLTLTEIDRCLIACNPARQIGCRFGYEQDDFTSKNIAETQRLLVLKAELLKK